MCVGKLRLVSWANFSRYILSKKAKLIDYNKLFTSSKHFCKKIVWRVVRNSLQNYYFGQVAWLSDVGDKMTQSHVICQT